MKKRDLFTIFFSVVAGLVILAQVKADPCGMVPPIFIGDQSSDIFWKNTFEELSYGRCPYGIYISNNNICCNYKDKKFCYNIYNETNSEIIYHDSRLVD